MKVSWPSLLEEISHCQKCRLCEKRTNTVPGEGNPHAKVLFIGERQCREHRLVRLLRRWGGVFGLLLGQGGRDR